MLKRVLIGKLTLHICPQAGVSASAGEGYECTVTVDDEDSKILVFDNWKQVSEPPALLGTLGLFGAPNEPVVIGGGG